MSARALDAAVAAFIDDVTDALEQATAGLDGVSAESLRADVTAEAFNLTTAMIDADQRHTVDELEALIDAFGRRLGDTTLIFATPADLRGSALVVDRRHWLDQNSELFGILTDADARHRTHLAEHYYERALDIAHVVVSLDAVPARSELEAISALRTRLLGRLRQRGPAPEQAPFGDTEPVADGSAAGQRDAVSTDAAADAAAEAAADPPARPLEELLAELDELIGLDEVKARVHLVADLLQVQKLRADRGLPTTETSHHLVFTGNPGTGKTTVARLLAQIYRTLGVVERGHLVETDRSGLVAGFVGQTAPRVTATFDQADQGMLFIDEAYTLARGNENDFGREAIDQIVKLMEDRRDRVVLVVAGYPVEMEELLSTNPGLRSRFPTVIEFPDYSTDQIVAIVDSIGAKQRYVLTDDARDKLRRVIDEVPRTKGFGNARVGRNLYEAAQRRHASRVVRMDEHSDELLTTLTADDVPDGASSPDGNSSADGNSSPDGNSSADPTEQAT
ncbi:MAG: AAA family ATPase [Microthrixaceae bacterium]